MSPLPRGGDHDRTRERNVQTVRTYFRLLVERDIDQWIELWAEEARFLMPFMPEGFPDRVEGRKQLERSLRDLLVNYGDYTEDVLAVHPMNYPNLVLAQWHTTAHVVKGPFAGRSYDTDIVGIFRFRDDGKLVEVTEYFHAVQFLKSIGRA
jgi:ketosteroid isomerase-like protein